MAATNRAVHSEEARGFTVTELLIAVVIVSILAAVAIPAYSSNVRKGRQVNAQRVLMALAQAEEIYRFENGQYTGTVAQLTALGFVDDSTGPSAGGQWYPQANITFTPANPTTTFTAQIWGSIGGSVNDIWTIDQNGTLTNTQNGT